GRAKDPASIAGMVLGGYTRAITSGSLVTSVAAAGEVVRDLASIMAQSCHSPEFCQKVQCSALTLKVRCRTMGRKNQVFAQPFAEIWQYSPFPPSAHLAEFLQQFTVSGYFDAERFWAFVSASRPSQQNAQAVGRRSSTSGPTGFSLHVCR